MKIQLFGCKDTTLHVAKSIKELGAEIHLVTISPIKGKEQSVAGYCDLTKHEALFNSIYIAKRYDLNSMQDKEYITGNGIDVGFSIGWQRLIPKEILKSFKCGVFGMHGSAQDLPYGRGRSPMNWSIIEGREWFFTNLFKYQSGVDNGPIVGTDCFSIKQEDTSETLHYKNILSFISLIKSNWEQFEDNCVRTTPQKNGYGSLYPKRTPDDGIIDWSDNIFNIDRLIKAVSRPFDGAFSYINGKKIFIFRASIFYTDIESHQFKEREFGIVCDIFPNHKFLIRANGGVLIVHDYVTDFKYLECNNILISPKQKIKDFARNKYGFYDI